MKDKKVSSIEQIILLIKEGLANCGSQSEKISAINKQLDQCENIRAVRAVIENAFKAEAGPMYWLRNNVLRQTTSDSAKLADALYDIQLSLLRDDKWIHATAAPLPSARTLEYVDAIKDKNSDELTELALSLKDKAEAPILAIALLLTAHDCQPDEAKQAKLEKAFSSLMRAMKQKHRQPLLLFVLIKYLPQPKQLPTTFHHFIVDNELAQWLTQQLRDDKQLFVSPEKKLSTLDTFQLKKLFDNFQQLSDFVMSPDLKQFLLQSALSLGLADEVIYYYFVLPHPSAETTESVIRFFLQDEVTLTLLYQLGLAERYDWQLPPEALKKQVCVELLRQHPNELDAAAFDLDLANDGDASTPMPMPTYCRTIRSHLGRLEKIEHLKREARSNPEAKKYLLPLLLMEARKKAEIDHIISYLEKGESIFQFVATDDIKASWLSLCQYLPAQSLYTEFKKLGKDNHSRQTVLLEILTTKQHSQPEKAKRIFLANIGFLLLQSYFINKCGENDSLPQLRDFASVLLAVSQEKPIPIRRPEVRSATSTSHFFTVNDSEISYPLLRQLLGDLSSEQQQWRCAEYFSMLAHRDLAAASDEFKNYISQLAQALLNRSVDLIAMLGGIRNPHLSTMPASPIDRRQQSALSTLQALTQSGDREVLVATLQDNLPQNCSSSTPLAKRAQLDATFQQYKETPYEAVSLFLDSLLLGLRRIFSAITVITSGLVSRASYTGTDKLLNIFKTSIVFWPIVGQVLPLTHAGLDALKNVVDFNDFFKAIAPEKVRNEIKSHKKKWIGQSETDKLKRISNLFITPADEHYLCLEVALLLTWRYQDQLISRLTLEQTKLLADAIISRIWMYLHEDKDTTLQSLPMELILVIGTSQKALVDLDDDLTDSMVLSHTGIITATEETPVYYVLEQHSSHEHLGFRYNVASIEYKDLEMKVVEDPLLKPTPVLEKPSFLLPSKSCTQPQV